MQVRCKTKAIIILSGILLILFYNSIPSIAVTPGNLRWSYDLGPGQWASTSLLTDGTIYMNGFGISQDGLMTFEADVKHGDTATIDSDGTIYAVGYEIDYINDPRRPIQHVYALNSNGDLNWDFTIDKGNEEGYFKRPPSPAVADNGTVYVGAPDGKFYAINSGGMKAWSFQTGSGIYSSAAIASTGTIYFGSFDGYLYALTPDGNQEWAFEVGYRISASPAISEDGTIYITSQASDLYAINPDGSLKWIHDATWLSSYTSPVVGWEGTIFYGAGDRIYAVNNDGTTKWVFPVSQLSTDSLAIGSDYTLYFGEICQVVGDCNFYAVNESGSVQWVYTIFGQGGEFTWPAIAADGTIYLTYNTFTPINTPAKLLAIHGDSQSQ